MEIACLSSTTLTNKAIYQESRSIYYSQNCFDLLSVDTEAPLTFLDQIGQQNTQWIERLILPFPSTHQLGEDIEFCDISARIFDKIQSYCPRLKTLTLCPRIDMCDAEDPRLDFICLGEVDLKMLEPVAARLREISSQLEVELRMYSSCDCVTQGDFKTNLDDYGWKVSIIGEKFCYDSE